MSTVLPPLIYENFLGDADSGEEFWPCGVVYNKISIDNPGGNQIPLCALISTAKKDEVSFFPKNGAVASYRLRTIEGWFERRIGAGVGYVGDSEYSLDEVNEPLTTDFSESLVNSVDPWFSPVSNFCSAACRSAQSYSYNNLLLGVIAGHQGDGSKGGLFREALKLLDEEIFFRGSRFLDESGPVPDSAYTACELHPWLTNVKGGESPVKVYENWMSLVSREWSWTKQSKGGSPDKGLVVQNYISQLVSLLPVETCASVLDKLPGYTPPAREKSSRILKLLLAWTMDDPEITYDDSQILELSGEGVQLDYCLYGKTYASSLDETAVTTPYYSLANSPSGTSTTSNVELWVPWLYSVLAGSMVTRMFSALRVHTKIPHRKSSLVRRVEFNFHFPALFSPEWETMISEWPVQVSPTEDYITTTHTKNVLVDNVSMNMSIGDTVDNFRYEKTSCFEIYLTSITPSQIISHPDLSQFLSFIEGESDELYGECYSHIELTTDLLTALKAGIIKYGWGTGDTYYYGDSDGTESSLGPIDANATCSVSLSVQEVAKKDPSYEIETVGESSSSLELLYPSKFARTFYADVYAGLAVSHGVHKYEEYDSTSSESLETTVFDGRFGGFHTSGVLDARGSQSNYQESYFDWVAKQVDEKLLEQESDSILYPHLLRVLNRIGGYMTAGERESWATPLLTSKQITCEALASGMYTGEGCLLTPFRLVMRGRFPVNFISNKMWDELDMYYTTDPESYILATMDVFGDPLAPVISSVVPEQGEVLLQSTCTHCDQGTLQLVATITNSDGVRDPLPFEFSFDLSRYFGFATFNRFRFTPGDKWAQMTIEQHSR